MRSGSLLFHRLHPDATIPAYQTPGSAGFDLCALHDTQIWENNLQAVPVRTGLAVHLPRGTVMMVVPRGGHALRHPGYVANSPGIIDEDYRGEILVLVRMLGSGNMIIAAGERFAQGVIVPYLQPTIEVVETLEETSRGTGRFNSTGR